MEGDRGHLGMEYIWSGVNCPLLFQMPSKNHITFRLLQVQLRGQYSFCHTVILMHGGQAGNSLQSATSAEHAAPFFRGELSTCENVSRCKPGGAVNCKMGLD